MKITYVVTRADEMGGVQVHVRDLARALHARGHGVRVVAGNSGPLFEQLRESGVPHGLVPDLVRPIAPWRDLKAVLQLRRLFAAQAPDLVSTHSSKAGLIGRVAARSLGIPVLFTAHGWAFTDGVPPMERRVYTLAERMAAPIGNHVITVSGFDRNLALARGIVRPGSITCIRNGVLDLPSHSVMDSGAGGGPPVRIVMVGRFAAQKDQAGLVRALARLKNLPFQLELVGDGPTQVETWKLVKSLGLNNRVRFLGDCDNVAEILAGADLFALISSWEGLPRSILEAMRAGLPVIASDVGGVSEVVEDGRTGILVPRGNVAALTAQLRPLLVDAALRRRQGAAGRRRFEAKFRFEVMFEHTLAVYDRVLAAARDRSRSANPLAWGRVVPR